MSAKRGRSNKGSGKGGPRGSGTKGGRGGDRRQPPPTRRSSTPGGVPDRRGRGVSGARGARSDGIGGDRVEGRQAVRELLVAGRRKVREVTISLDRKDAPVLDDIVELAHQLRVPVQEVGRSKLASLAKTDGHQGVIADAAPLPEVSEEELFSSRSGPAPFLLAADGVTDPGNLGALLRTAECAGVTGVVLPRHRAVHISPTVTKAAAGAVEHLRFCIVGGLPAALGRAQEAGVLVLGLDMGGGTGLHELPPVDGPVLIVVGAEGRGLSRLVRERCDEIVSIPLLGVTESLNVSVAGGLALYEVVRRRHVR